MLCPVVAGEVWKTLESGLPSDTARHIAEPDELPEACSALAEED